MSKKHLHKRLDTLFADLETETLVSGENPPGDLKGWVWQADSLGNYLNCSPEIHDVLGYIPAEAVGRAVFEFALSSASRQIVRDAIARGETSTEIPVEYHARDGRLLAARLYILANSSGSEEATNGRSLGFHGFTYLLEPQPETYSLPDVHSHEIHHATPEPLQPGAGIGTPKPNPDSSPPLPSPGKLIGESEIKPAIEPLSLAGLGSHSSDKNTNLDSPDQQIAALATPNRLQDKALDILELIDDRSTRQWSEDELNLVEQVVDQLSLALENAQLFQETQENARRNQALYQASRRLTPTSTLSDILSAFVEGVPIPAIKGAILWQFKSEPGQSETQFVQSAAWQRVASASAISVDTPQSLADYPALHLAVEQQPHFFDDIYQDDRLDPGTLNLLSSYQTHAAAFIPLWVGNRHLGTVLLLASESYHFIDRDIQPYQSLASQAAVVIENQELFEQTKVALIEMERRNLQLTTAAQVSRAASSILDPDTLVQDTVDLVQKRFSLYYVGLFLVDQSGAQLGEANRWAVLQAGTGEAGRVMKAQNHRLEVGGQSMVGQCIAAAQVQIWRGIEHHEDRFPNPLLPETRSEMALPLISRGEVIGAMTFQSSQPGDFSEADISVLQTMADQVANAILNTRLYTQTENALSDTERLYRASAEINIATNFQDILGTLSTRSNLGSAADLISLNLFDSPWLPDMEPEWINVYVDRTRNREIYPELRLSLASHPFFKTILKLDKPTVINNLAGQPGLDENSHALYVQQFGANCALFVPIVISGQWIGFFNTIHQKYNPFSEPDLRQFTALVNQAAVAVQNLQSLEITRQQANEATLLFQTSQELVHARDELDIYQAALQACRQFGEFDFVSVQLSKELASEDYLEQIVHTGASSITVPEDGSLYPVSLYPYIQPVLQGNRIVADSIADDQRFTSNEKYLLNQMSIRAQAILPLRTRTGVIGVLQAAYQNPHSFSLSETRFLETIVVQLGIALDNHRLLQETQRRARQLQTAAEVSRATTRILEIELLLQQVVDLVQERFDIYYAGLFLIDLDGQWTSEPGKWAVLRAGTGTAGIQMKAQGHKLVVDSSSMIGKSLLNAMAQVSHNVALEVGRYLNPLLPRTASEIALPLIVMGQVIGAMTIQSEYEAAFTEDDIATLQTMADQVAIAIQNARQFSQTQVALDETELLYNASAEFNTALISQDILNVLARHSILGQDCQLARINLFEQAWTDAKPPEYAMTLAVLPEPAADLTTYRLSETPLLDGTISHRGPTIIRDVKEEFPKYEQLKAFYREAGDPSSLIILPLVVGGQWIGFIDATFSIPHPFPESELRQLMALAGQAAVALQNLRSIELAEIRALEAQRRSEELALVNRIVANAGAHVDLQSALKFIAHEVGQAFNVQVGIALLNETRSGLVLLAEHFLTEGLPSAVGFQIPIANNPSTQTVLETRKPLIIPNAQTDPRLAPIHAALTARGVETLTIFPMVIGDEVMGTVGLDILEKDRGLTDEEIALAETIILQAAVAIQNLRLFEQTQASLAESEALYQANAELNVAQTFADVLAVLQAYTILGKEAGLVDVQLFDQPWTDESLPGWLIPIAHWSNIPESGTLPTRISIDSRLVSGQLLQAGFPTFVADLENDPRIDEQTRSLYIDHYQAKGVLFAPLNVAGNWVGHITAIYQQSMDFTESELRRLTTLAGQASVVIENIRNTDLTRQRARQLEKLAGIQSALSQANSEKEILSALVLTVGPDDIPENITLEYIQPGAGGATDIAELMAYWRDGAIQSIPHVTRAEVVRNPFASLWLAAPDETLFITDTGTDSRLGDNIRRELQKAGIGAVVVIPLRSGGHWQGITTYTWAKSHEFTPDELFLLRRMLEPASEVVARRRAFIAQRHARQESERRAIQLQTAAEIARDTTGTLALDELLKRAINLVSERYGFYHAAIYLLNENNQQAVARAAAGIASQEFIVQEHLIGVGSHSIIGHVSQTGETLIINDVANEARYKLHPLLPYTASELAIPLHIADRVIGVLDVHSEKLDAFSAEEAAVLQVLADQLAVAVDNARSYEIANQAFRQARDRAQEMTLLFSVSQALASAPLESDEIASIITKEFATIMDVHECTLSILDNGDDLGKLTILGHYRSSTTGWQKKIDPVVLGNNPLISQVMQSLKSSILHSSQEHDSATRAYLQSKKADTILVIPLSVKGEAIGIIELISRHQERQYTPEQLNLGLTLANAAAVALENARLYEMQRETAERLLEVDTIKTQFLANMSHELRTPLNSIIGFSRVIMKGIDGPITPLQEQDLSAIYNSGQHLLSLITDILDLSKIEAGKMELAVEEFDLSDLIHSVMPTAAGLTKEKSVELQRAIQPDLPMIIGDRTRIRQVLINLLANAAKFTEQGFIRISAHLQKNRQGIREIYVSVTDSGPGITTDDQEKLFKPFSQVDASPTRKTGGTGLGLSISRHLVEMHGGQIGVESTSGEGSTFYFTIPLPEQEMVEATTLAGTQPLILAVDDNQQVISLYERYLAGHGYQVIAVTDPYQALERARQLHPAAITLDIMMPGQDGWQVLEALKSDPETQDIPVIICTILENQAKGFSLGAADYLIKPILEEELVSAMRRLNSDQSIRRVLAVDDDPDDLRLLQKILEQNQQFKVTLAQGGHEALSALQQAAPQAIILDLYMPGLDGFSLLETLKSEPRWRDIPVIIFTGGDLNDEQRQMLARFGESMLQKGVISEQDLLASLERSLRRIAPLPIDY